MYNTPRAASIKTASGGEGQCVLWEIDRASYRGIISYFKYNRNIQYQEFLRQVQINDHKLGNLLTDSELEKMTISLERETFEPGDTIIRQGNSGDHFYIISEGNVGVYKADPAGKENKLATLHVGNYFGEKALLKEDVRQASCIAESKVVCLTLGRDDFVEMMGTFDDMMNKDKKTEAAAAAAASNDALANEKASFSLAVSLDEIDIKATLGCGAFGRVKLCRVAKKDKYFALKCQAKRNIVESGLQEHVLNEMRVMKKIDHPYIAKLYCAMQDKQYIYFLLELLQGGELFTHLRNRGKLSEQAARFYAATVVYAFSTLHAKKIAYRDLKPENLVLIFSIIIIFIFIKLFSRR
jgi:CRP-like cAMP-binding protein